MIASFLAAAAIASASTTPPIAPPAVRPTVITNPDWVKRPSGNDVAQVWPAGGYGVNGVVNVRCVVTVRGLLDNCRIVRETPTGHGFGGAALLLTRMFEMRPKMVNGAPVGGADVEIPIDFKGAGYSRPREATTIIVADNLLWRETPSAADVAAAWPRGAPSGLAAARVVLRCRVVADGTIRDCESTFEDPAYRGFDSAAKHLSAKFKAITDGPPFTSRKEFFVSLPFDFRNPGLPAMPVQVVSPEWLTGPDPNMVAAVFPAQAAKAGLRTGVGVVTCEVAHDGHLTACTVSGESPANLGFGEAALRIGATMSMNPWTKQGDPVDGARVNLPIRLNIAPEATPPAVAR